MRKTLGVMGIGLLTVALAGCPDSAPTDKDKPQDVANRANQCYDAARQGPDGDMLKNREMQSSNLSEYKAGEPFDLKVTLPGEGNSFLQLNCTIDADGKVSYQNYEKTETQVGEKVGVPDNVNQPSGSSEKP